MKHIDFLHRFADVQHETQLDFLNYFDYFAPHYLQLNDDHFDLDHDHDFAVDFDGYLTQIDFADYCPIIVLDYFHKNKYSVYGAC